jgi:hypothetical protein
VFKARYPVAAICSVSFAIVSSTLSATNAFAFSPSDPTTCKLSGYVTFAPPITTPPPAASVATFRWTLRGCVGSNNGITGGSGMTTAPAQAIACTPNVGVGSNAALMSTSGVINWTPAANLNNNLTINTSIVVPPNAGNVDPSSNFTAGPGPAGGAGQVPPVNPTLPYVPGQVLGGTVRATTVAALNAVCGVGKAMKVLKYNGWLTFWS